MGERMPAEEEGGSRDGPFREVLVCTEKGAVLSLACDRIRDWNEGRILPGVKTTPITHWMPMPAGPITKGRAKCPT